MNKEKLYKWILKKLNRKKYLEYLKFEGERLKECIEKLGGDGLIMFDEYNERELNLIEEEIAENTTNRNCKEETK